ncbi:CATRA conflict system CASPASE/TPR repeat-associated protein [Streptomyces galilaeus]
MGFSTGSPGPPPSVVDRPALLTHFFYPADHFAERPSAARSHLNDLWAAIGTLGLTAPVGTHPTVPDTTGVPPVTDTLRLLAAARRPAPGEVHTALVCQWHDTVVFTLMQAPNSASTRWTDLAVIRSALPPPPEEAVLGTASVHLGVLTAAAPTDPPAVAQLMRPEIPAPADTDWGASGVRTRQGFLVWELPGAGPQAAPTQRRLAVLAPPASEEELDAWLWSSATAGLVPFTRYLVHAAKTRYERRLLLSGLAGLRDLRTGVEGICDSLFTDATGWNHSTAGPSVDALSRARHDLRRLRGASGGIAASLSALRGLAQTLEVATSNMEAAVGVDFPGADRGLLSHDLRTAALTLAQARAEEIYLSAAHTRAGDVIALAEAETSTRLGEHQARLTLWQTSFLGGLLMLLAAVQALTYELPLPGPLMAPVICVLSSLALALPMLSWHWSLTTAPPRRARTAVVACAAVGASAGWLLYSLTTHLLHRTDSPGPTVLAAAAGAALLMAVDSLRVRHIRQTRARHT